MSTDSSSDRPVRENERLDSDGVARQRPAYTESQVIMTTVKVVVPFVLTYGLYMMFHGAGSPGGSFQGGALVASVIIMIAFAFGIDATRIWVSNTILVGLATVGVLIFGGLALATIALGGAFLDYSELLILNAIVELPANEWAKWGMETIEIGGIAFIVAGVLMGLFFLLASGYDPEADSGHTAEVRADD